MSESSGASSAQTGYHARRVHRAFHIRTLKAVKKVVNRDERRLRAENEEKSTLSIMLTGGMSKDRVHRSVSVSTSREGPRNEKKPGKSKIERKSCDQKVE